MAPPLGAEAALEASEGVQARARVAEALLVVAPGDGALRTQASPMRWIAMQESPEAAAVVEQEAQATQASPRAPGPTSQARSQVSHRSAAMLATCPGRQVTTC